VRRKSGTTRKEPHKTREGSEAERRRKRGWEEKARQSVSEKCKCKSYPRVISLLKYLILTRGTHYIDWELPTDVISDQIFAKTHLCITRRILHRLKSSNWRNMGYILRRLSPSNQRSVFNALKFCIFTFFSLFYFGYEWQLT